MYLPFCYGPVVKATAEEEDKCFVCHEVKIQSCKDKNQCVVCNVDEAKKQKFAGIFITCMTGAWVGVDKWAHIQQNCTIFVNDEIRNQLKSNEPISIDFATKDIKKLFIAAIISTVLFVITSCCVIIFDMLGNVGGFGFLFYFLMNIGIIAIAHLIFLEIKKSKITTFVYNDYDDRRSFLMRILTLEPNIMRIGRDSMKYLRWYCMLLGIITALMVIGLTINLILTKKINKSNRIILSLLINNRICNIFCHNDLCLAQLILV